MAIEIISQSNLYENMWPDQVWTRNPVVRSQKRELLSYTDALNPTHSLLCYQNRASSLEFCTTSVLSSEFVSSSIPSWQILTVHAQPFRGARDLAFCLKVPLDSLLVWASSRGSGETAWMCRLAWTFAARIGDKYQIRLMQPKCKFYSISIRHFKG